MKGCFVGDAAESWAELPRAPWGAGGVWAGPVCFRRLHSLTLVGLLVPQYL